MSDNFKDETDSILIWIVSYNNDTRIVELKASATLFELMSCVMYTFEIPHEELDNIKVKCEGRVLSGEEKTLFQLGVGLGTPLEVLLEQPQETSMGHPSGTYESLP